MPAFLMWRTNDFIIVSDFVMFDTTPSLAHNFVSKTDSLARDTPA
jgi:hypothetical protein